MLGVRDWGVWKPSLNLRTPIVKEPRREGMGTEGEVRVRRQLWGLFFCTVPFKVLSTV